MTDKLKILDQRMWWQCSMVGTDGYSYAVFGSPAMKEDEARSWCEQIGGDDLRHGGYELNFPTGTSEEQMEKVTQSFSDLLNERDEQKVLN